MEIDSDDEKDPLDSDDDSAASESECSSDETVDETAVSSDSEPGDNEGGLKRLLEDVSNITQRISQKYNVDFLIYFIIFKMIKIVEIKKKRLFSFIFVYIFIS